MAVLLVFLGVGVLGYLAWKRRATTLTRNCRWRQDRKAGDWLCTYCSRRRVSEREPIVCMNPAQGGADRD